MARRIGIYSGTFDPVHAGHVAFGTEAMRVCALDEVIFLPERLPRAKHNVMDISQRLALLEEAIATKAGLQILNLQSARFTVHETLPELQRILGDAKLVLLVGSDVVKTFPYRWDGLDLLLTEVSLAIGMRSGDSHAQMAEIIAELERSYSITINHKLIHTEHMNISSSAIKERQAKYMY